MSEQYEDPIQSPSDRDQGLPAPTPNASVESLLADLYSSTPTPAPASPPVPPPVTVEPEPEPEPDEPEPPVPSVSAPSLASIAGAYRPTSLIPGRAPMPAPEIACYASIGVLAILYRAAADSAGGYEFSANDVMLSVPELAKAFVRSNGIGTYLGYSGLIVVNETIEPGIDLPKVTGHSPFWFSPSFEAASAALRKLQSHPELFWTHADIAKRAGATDPADLATAITKLWSHSRWLKTYPRGRRRRQSKAGKRSR